MQKVPQKQVDRLFTRAPDQLFLVLPTNLEDWEVADTTKHSFRLYFLCNNTDHTSWKPTSDPRHVHISTHLGYEINRPQEFLQQYGRHALALLLIVKFGFFGGTFRLPSLDTLKSTMPTNQTTFHYQLSQDNIGLFVNKAITYIHAIQQVNVKPRSKEDADPWGVRSFLRLQGADSGTGDLCLYQHAESFTTRWMCMEHFPLDSGTESLRQYVHSYGGSMDLHHCTIQIKLSSKFQAGSLASFRKQAMRHFELFVFIAWRASRKELQEIIQELIQAGFHLLHVHGIPPNVADNAPIEFRGDGTNLVVLHNYPRPNEYRVAVSLQQEKRRELLGLVVHQPVKVLDVNWHGLL